MSGCLCMLMVNVDNMYYCYTCLWWLWWVHMLSVWLWMHFCVRVGGCIQVCLGSCSWYMAAALYLVHYACVRGVYLLLGSGAYFFGWVGGYACWHQELVFGARRWAGVLVGDCVVYIWVCIIQSACCCVYFYV